MTAVRRLVRRQRPPASRPARWRLLSVLVAAAFGFASIMFNIVPAAAEECSPPSQLVQVKVSDNPLTYEWQCIPPDDPGDPGDPGDSCELVDPFTYCQDGQWCYQSEWHPPWAMPDEPKPSEDAEAVIENCATPPSTFPTSYPVWDDDGEPPIPDPDEQARTAFGQLLAPAFDLAFSPGTGTYVGTETHFWVEGPGDEELVGTSAFTVVAIATPDHVEVDPGDGTGTMNCGWATSETADCVEVYLKTSNNPDGRVAFPARARLVYSVHFENSGVPFTPDGVPTTLESDWAGTPVPVGEVQVIVE